MMQVAYVIFWWLALLIVGLVSFPLVSRVCSNLSDKGYSISKLVGLLILTFLVWIFSSLKILPFGYISILISFFLLAALSIYLGRKNLSIANWPLKQILISESVFAIFFVIFLVVVMQKPDLQFAFFSEDFMDFSFLQSVLRSDYFPPIDPWLAGENIPYYYGGHLLTASLTFITRVPPEVAFNVAVAMFFALAVCASYGLGYNITKRYLYGALTALFVCMCGYIFGALQLVAYISHHSVLGLTPIEATNIGDWMLSFDFWGADWSVMQHAVARAPYTTFIIGDLHANMMDVPFQVMFIALIFAVFRKGSLIEGNFNRDSLLSIVILGLGLGFFPFLNAWDYPTYIVFAILAFVFLAMKPSIKGALCILAVIGLSFILYIPLYTSGGMTGFSGLGLVTERTSLGRFLMTSILFLFVIFSLLFVWPKRELLARRWVMLVGAFILLATILAAILLKYQLFILMVPLIGVSLYYIYNSKSKGDRDFILLLAIMGASIALFCEVLYFNDALPPPYKRYNTVLKLYPQIWIFLAVAAACGVSFVVSIIKGKVKKTVWVTILVVFIIASIIHPIASTTAWTSGRHESLDVYGGRGSLDGMAYLESQNKGDYLGIRWINSNVDGRPVILEAPGNSGEYSSRVSALTGLPTVIGWQSWEIMWGRSWDDVGERTGDVDAIYNTLDNDEALELLKKYGVEYIYIGSVEREKYESEGLQKFAAHPEAYESVFEYEGTTIFKVRENDGTD